MPSSSHPRAIRQEGGQASLEWMAIVALVATVLGFGAALAQADYVGRRVTREMARAICIVGAGDCARDREPCVVGSRAGGQAVSVDLGIVHLGEDGLALVERRSDGTVAVTVQKGQTLGLQAAAGLGGEVHAGALDVAIGGEVEASLLARLGHGRTWIVGSEAEATHLLDHLGDAPEPDVVSGEGAWLSALRGSVGADGLVQLDAAHGSLTFDRRAGTRTDRRTGHDTIYVQASWAGAGAVDGVLGVAGGRAGETYAVELDATGRPVDLRVVASGRFAGSRDLPEVAQPVAGLLAEGPDADRVYEVTAHLDLTDARNLAAARELLDAVARHRASAQPSQALRRRIDEQGTVEARVLEQHASADDQGVTFTLEMLRVGGTAHVERRTQRLVAATSRGLDGRWLPRTDCVRGATT
ncbi:MAG TPA: hypothetical protein VK501_19610 [Baekduia sp.]|uniref:hypothetical protein n=1 Tax=Baekduia sp. TaxID=2600305 RepID=UPI002BFCFE02|nr:hypothetical protein [Baekduia sp.]HMJ36121.1 hypothetical protein [Baekduia sp.]